MPEITVKITQRENAEYFGCLTDDTVEVDFEKYVASVVAGEVGNAPIEACKAQAIAARSLAISRGALRGLVISDDASVMQAYRAKRYDSDKYPNAILGAEETEGQVLTYNGNIAVAHYSANNGGRTTSSEERWGTAYPYLISQKDNWDAADGTPKYGHGVGMSQKGAIYAAKNGASYRTILNFYYPNCVIKDDYGGLIQKETMHMTKSVLMNEKTEKIVELAKSLIGSPYVFGALGEKRNGVQVFDCRGYTYWLLKQVGVTISTVGATTQYNTAKDWVERGRTKDMPNVVCPVFKYRESDGKMSHTGMHIGNGQILHCTTNGGVKYGSLSDTTWTHYGIPKGLYTEEELKKAGVVVMMTTLKNGSSGSAVVQLQTWLNEMGYDAGYADGKFGSRTKEAVMRFQADNGLTADGIVGTLTWNALEKTRGADEDEPVDERPWEPEEPKDEIREYLEKIEEYIDKIREALG